MAQDIVIIGAGPAGLAAAGALALRGRSALVLERTAEVGASWRGHYDRLRLHTTPRLSSLPGLRIPAGYGRWIARDDFVRYLEAYRDHHRIRITGGVSVARIERLRAGAGPRWRVVADDGRAWPARDVIVATGYNHTPLLPRWPGQESFGGRLLHAGDYRGPRPFAGQRVLVVGTGNTGCEIAQDLAEAGAPTVWLSYRTPPHIVRRDTGPWAAQYTGVLVRHLPPALVDPVARALRRAQLPDLRPHGLPEPAVGLTRRVREGAIPVQDVGIVAAITSGAVSVVPAVDHFDSAAAVLVDGQRVRPDSVIVAAGYGTGLTPMVGHLQVLDERELPRVRAAFHAPGAPGLYFLGFTNPISGMLREIARDSRRIAEQIATDQASSRTTDRESR